MSREMVGAAEPGMYGARDALIEQWRERKRCFRWKETEFSLWKGDRLLDVAGKMEMDVVLLREGDGRVAMDQIGRAHV